MWQYGVEWKGHTQSLSSPQVSAILEAPMVAEMASPGYRGLSNQSSKVSLPEPLPFPPSPPHNFLPPSISTRECMKDKQTRHLDYMEAIRRQMKANKLQKGKDQVF